MEHEYNDTDKSCKHDNLEHELNETDNLEHEFNETDNLEHEFNETDNLSMNKTTLQLA